VATALAVGGDSLSVNLTSYEEVPAVSSPATATFTADVAGDESSITWKLSYSGLMGAVQQALEEMRVPVGLKRARMALAGRDLRLEALEPPTGHRLEAKPR
jgi:hypothetical protein